MKSSLLTVLLLSCLFVLAPAIPGARADDWYQGQPGMWQHHGHRWEWRGKHGDEWFEGKRGHWYAERDKRWYWQSDDGREYRQRSHGWAWSGRRAR
jgi:hypothetical protein